MIPAAPQSNASFISCGLSGDAHNDSGLGPFCGAEMVNQISDRALAMFVVNQQRVILGAGKNFGDGRAIETLPTTNCRFAAFLSADFL